MGKGSDLHALVGEFPRPFFLGLRITRCLTMWCLAQGSQARNKVDDHVVEGET